MAAKGRVLVVLNIGISLSSIPNSLLFGHVQVRKNGNTTLYVDSVVPVFDKKNLFRPLKFATNICNGTLYSSARLIGLVLEDKQICEGDFIKYLTDTLALSSFYLVVLPILGSLRKRLVAVLRTDNHMNIPLNEAVVISLRSNRELSPLSSLFRSHEEKMKNLQEEKFSLLPQELNNWVNGLARNQYAVDNKDANNVESHAARLLCLLYISILWMIKWIPGVRHASSLRYFIDYISNFFFVAKQLMRRLKQLTDMLGGGKENLDMASIDEGSVKAGNQMLSVFIDVVLGLAVVYFIFSSQDFLSISTWIIGQKYTVAEHLQNLLKWLMGVPAGLKLNKPLNQFLGSFYIYHVHLWTSYLYFIEAYFPSIILMCTLSGCLGITFLLSVLCDVLSLLTLHIYCFYIYAARLYGLEIHALMALLRLFTGKKWNILRSRVDSVGYDVDRLFIGTLLFTILLFLFPTILLYYIVFTCLRFVVLLVQAVLFSFVALLNTFPFYGLWLYFTDSECLPGSTVIDVQTENNTHGSQDPDSFNCNVHGDNFVRPHFVLFLSLKHRCFPLGNLFKKCFTAVVDVTCSDIFGKNMFKKLLTGQLFVSNYKS